MSVRYSTIWMGPVNYDWILRNGDHWSTGRIEVYDTDSAYPEEISLPVMHTDDWNRFSKWLMTFETDFAWTLGQLLSLYEKENPAIVWLVEE